MASTTIHVYDYKCWEKWYNASEKEGGEENGRRFYVGGKEIGVVEEYKYLWSVVNGCCVL